MGLTPYPYQEHDIQHIIDHNGVGLVVAQVGAGKTLVGIEVGLRLGASVKLVIAPKGTHKRVWIAGIKAQDPQAVVSTLENSSRAGKEAFHNLLSHAPGWYVITPQLFTRMRMKLTVDMAIVDEIHLLTNRKGKGFHALRLLTAKNRLAMSGTPARNRVENMWAVLRWVYPETTDRSFWRFAAEYFKMEYDPFAGQKIVGELQPGRMVSELDCYLQHYKREQCCAFHPRGFLDGLPEPSCIQRTVQLSPAQKKFIKQMENDYVAWLDENPVVAELPIVARIRLRQATLGMPSFGPEGEITFADDCESPKLDELLNILDEMGDEPALVFTSSQKFARVVARRLQAAGIDSFEWSGHVPQHERDKALEGFIGGKIRVMVAVTSAFGTGTDGAQLAASTVVWLDRSDDRTDVEQAEGRLDRTGQTRQVVSIELIAEGSLDEGIISKQLSERLAMNASLRRSVA